MSAEHARTRAHARAHEVRGSAYLLPELGQQIDVLLLVHPVHRLQGGHVHVGRASVLSGQRRGLHSGGRAAAALVPCVGVAPACVLRGAGAVYFCVV